MSTNATTMGKQAPGFIPEFWSKLLNKKLEKSGAGMKIVNKNYEGEIKNSGDTVHIQEVPGITVTPYDRTRALSYETPNGTSQALVIDQEKYFAFKVQDITKAQSNVSLADKFMEEAKKGIEIVKDSFILGKFSDIPNGNKLADVTLTVSNAYAVFVNLARILKNNGAMQTIDAESKIFKTSNKTGEAMPYVVINPDVEAVLLQTPEFIHASDSGDKVLRNGSIGSIAGLDIMVSNNLPTAVDGKVNIMAGINDAITFASQVIKIETIRDTEGFNDLVRGLFVYGAKTVIPNALSGITVTVSLPSLDTDTSGDTGDTGDTSST